MTEALDIAAVQHDADRVLAEELYWFPVRHHSPAAARHVRAAIRARKPKLVMIEGPAHTSELIAHVVDAKTKPPVALYSSFGKSAVWYPLLAYSPEYVAMKEAAAVGAACVFIDLPHHALHGRYRDDDDDQPEPDAHDAVEPSWEALVVESDFYQTMARVAGYHTWDEAWDSLFEIGHRHATTDEFRRDLAYFCAAVRATTPRARMERDGTLARERFMKRAIADELARHKLSARDAMVVCGGFHLFLDRDDAEPPPPIPDGTTLATVVPYSYLRVSELSGYAAGNRAPRYYQTVWEHQDDKDEEPWVGAMVDHVTAVLARGRKDGEVLSSADAISVTQHARMLAALRGRPAPILDDIRDALVSCCVKGRPDEEGRGLLQAMTRMEVGTAIGRVTPALGRLPIVHDFYTHLDELDLEEIAGKDKRLVLTLDLRDDLGARRSAFLHRLGKLGVPLGELEGKPTGDGTTLFREKWRLAWSPSIEPELIEKNLLGDTLEAAAMAQLEEDIAKEQRHAGNSCLRLRESVSMQLPQVVQRLAAVAGAAIDEDRHFNSQCEALVHLLVLDRLAIQRDLGRAAIADLATRAYTRACLAMADLGAIPVEQQEVTLAHLKSLAEAVFAGDQELDRAVFSDAVRSAALAATVPFMQGAFAGLLAELREIDPADLAQRVAAFASSHPSKMVLAGEFLDGAFAVSKTSMLLGAEALVQAIDELLRAAPWEDFLTLLPKVRSAFERLHERQRLSFADRVAVKYGLADSATVAEVPVTSSGAAAYLARIDARVAEIMKEWTF